MDGQELSNLNSMTTPLCRERERRVAVQQEWLASIQIDGYMICRWINVRSATNAGLEPNGIVSIYFKKILIAGCIVRWRHSILTCPCEREFPGLAGT